MALGQILASALGSPLALVPGLIPGLVLVLMRKRYRPGSRRSLSRIKKKKKKTAFISNINNGHPCSLTAFGLAVFAFWLFVELHGLCYWTFCLLLCAVH